MRQASNYNIEGVFMIYGSHCHEAVRKMALHEDQTIAKDG